MSDDFDSELRKLAADLRKAARGATDKARVVVRKTALDGVKIAKNLAPVDKGDLKSSIGATFSRGDLEAEYGPTVEYGPYVELGTSRMRPQPYLGPSAEQIEGPFAAAMEQLGGSIL